jgi:CHASE3 domain sensor protein
MQKATARYRTTGLNAAMFAIAALVLMVMVSMSYREWRQYSRANADAARTREIVDSVDILLSSVIDAESGQRGFLLTGDDSYLEPYNRAVQALPGQIAHLNSLLAARPAQSTNLAKLNSLIRDKLTELQQTIALAPKALRMPWRS